MIFTIEDYSGNLECMLFKEMYVKFKHYAEEPGYIIHLKGTCQPGYRDKEKLELRIQEVELLSETRSKKPLKVKMRMSLDNLDQKSIQAIKETIKTHPGSDRITLEIVHDQMAVPFRSANGVVQVNKALMKSLSRFGDVQLGVA